jgi:iron complex transport system substrate-binding protein
MRIVSLLPSATEIVFALGLGDDLLGVSFECDFPPAARELPHVSGTALGSGLTPAEIDAEVAASVQAGASMYTLDSGLIRELAPELIVAQDLCHVCAVPAGAVDAALDVIGCRAEVLSLDPHRLDEVIACVGAVGAATGTTGRAATVMAELRGRVDAVRRRVAGLPRPLVLVLEWSDPPFSAGHWVPEMVAAAGGEPVLAHAGERSRPLEWSAIAEAATDAVVFMPCGFGLADAVEQARPLLDRRELRGVERFFAVDGNAYFSRPGPRVVDGVELLGELLHPTSAGPPVGGRRLR